MLSEGSSGEIAHLPEICGMGLNFTLDGFRALYGAIAAFMWFMSTLFSREYFGHYRNRNRYYLFLLLTLGATEGVFLSADFYTTFLFFEMMSFTSYVWVAHDERQESLRAAGTYLAVAVIGGLVMLMGIFLLYNMTGTLRFDELIGLAGKEGMQGVDRKDVGSRTVHAVWFRSKSRCVPFAYLASQSPPGGPGPGIGTFIWNPDQGGNVWNFNPYKLHFSVGQCMGKYDSRNWRLHHGDRSGACPVFSGLKAYAGLFLCLSDRFYPGGCGNVRTLGEEMPLPCGEVFSTWSTIR